jgi:sugar lactone lactonase YvrE
MQNLDLDNLDFVGTGLNRPECVLATAAGNLYTADWDGGVARIDPLGKVEKILARAPGFALKPNGIALCRDGSFYIAHLGDEGGVYRLQRNGDLDLVLGEIEGSPLPAANFVLLDAHERLWITVSTRLNPRTLDFHQGASSGFIALLDRKGARVVADGLGYTNEVSISPVGNWLYVNETFGRRLSRFPMATDGQLGRRETVTEFGPGTYPDGLCFDERGGLWVISIVSNRLFYLEPGSNRAQLVLEDADPEHLSKIEEAFQQRRMGREHLAQELSLKLGSISSLAFGGPDLRTAYLGSLLDQRLARFRAPVAGRRPVHWTFDS